MKYSKNGIKYEQDELFNLKDIVREEKSTDGTTRVKKPPKPKEKWDECKDCKKEYHCVKTSTKRNDYGMCLDFTHFLSPENMT